MAGDVTDCWRPLGRQLDVEEGRIDGILRNTLYSEIKEKAFQVLNAWRDQGRSSTFQSLANALKALGKYALVEKHCKQVQVDNKRSSQKSQNLKKVNPINPATFTEKVVTIFSHQQKK